MTIMEAFDVVRSLGNENQECLRKGVGCMLATREGDGFTMRFLAQNGPVNGAKCSNEVGNCGCMHAEIRVVVEMLLQYWGDETECSINAFNWAMICTYSPCTQCANFIVEFAPWIKTVYFEILTDHDVRGRNRLQDAGIRCTT